jgi:hypothetical protein
VFDPTKEVPSLELCKKLKELGFPQDGGGWYWTLRKDSDFYDLFFTMDKIYFYKPKNHPNKFSLFEDWNLKEYIKAPTCRELDEWLPEYIKRLGDLIMEKRYNGGWIVRYEEYYELEDHHKDDIKDEKYCSVERIADTEPNARAEMLIWLRENGYTKFEVIE